MVPMAQSAQTDQMALAMAVSASERVEKVRFHLPQLQFFINNKRYMQTFVKNCDSTYLSSALSNLNLFIHRLNNISLGVPPETTKSESVQSQSD